MFLHCSVGFILKWTSTSMWGRGGGNLGGWIAKLGEVKGGGGERPVYLHL